MKVDPTIDTLVCPFFLFSGACSNEAQCPPLELVRVLLGEQLRTASIDGLADHFVLSVSSEGVLKAMLDQCHREMGDIDPNPLSIQALGHCDSSATPTEWVKNDISFVAPG